jgi:hypothetical protein
MLASGKDWVPKCLGVPNEFFVVGKFLTKFEENIVDISCPYLYLSKPISLLGFWEDCV